MAGRPLQVLGMAVLIVAIGPAACSREAKPIPTQFASAATVETTQASTALGVFEDVTSASGLSFTHRNGEEAGHFTILESLGGGVALFDYDRDGLLDVFLTGGGHFAGADNKAIQGHPCKLYQNLGRLQFKDVTNAAGLETLAAGEPWFYTHGCATADYDNDGWPDLLVTGWGRVALFHNEPVDASDPKQGRRLVDVTAAVGLDKDILWATSAAFGDLDQDGLPDLYLCQYVDWSWKNHPACKDLRSHSQPDVCTPEMFGCLPDLLFRNDGGKRFTNISADAGLRGPRPDDAYAKLTHLDAESRAALRNGDRAKNYGKGLGVLIADFNDDGRPDIFVANDTSGNFLYVNRGGARFAEVAGRSGVAYDDAGTALGSMGVDAAACDGTGRLSLFVANFQNQLHGLYRNRGQGQFIFAGRSAGFASLGLHYVGFGTGFLDFDADGQEDIVLSNGHVVHHPPPPAEVETAPPAAAEPAPSRGRRRTSCASRTFPPRPVPTSRRPSRARPGSGGPRQRRPHRHSSQPHQ